ncbi:MAG TPA: ABC transporter ATP-binding protein/permease [Candidatus Onthousia faecigallinarum]|nr:ABC transporter ATP-binding protein/permease [Candidatus Onthousia faecigallinarum]
MLELKHIKKSYKTGNFVQHALKDVSIKFRKNEFVAILGPSGSGKTTLLNIIGGLDRYDSGDLIINNKSTKQFKATDWDSYRNNCIGFIFQTYNLIGHISVLENVEMALTLSGYKRKDKRKKALEALDKVGLKDHAYKKPNQLSGGQMQRVAIARALVNDPDIILADEPTGALDSKTSIQIMDLIKEIAKDKLVIMVTHNASLAEEYATRIIEFKDGEVVHDSNPIKKEEKETGAVHIRKTVLSYLSALHLSFNNIKTKKGRTFLTAFAASIGIIGIALILSLSNGFQIQIDEFEKSTLSQMPITISEQSIQLDEETMEEQMQVVTNDKEKYPTRKEVIPVDSLADSMLHQNIITEDYINYIEALDQSLLGGKAYQRATALNLITEKEDGTYQKVNTGTTMNDMWQVFPSRTEEAEAGVVEENYDVLAGNLDSKELGLILAIDSKNGVNKTLLETLGFSGEENVSFDQLLGKEMKVVLNNDYYQNYGNYFMPNTDYEALYQNENDITVRIKAIIRGKEDKEMITNGSTMYYTEALIDQVIDQNKESDIVKAQEERDYNILSGSAFDEENTKEIALSYLGADTVPSAIYLYPKDFNSKDEITEYLDKYNEGKEEQDQIVYTDMAAMMSDLSGNIMDAITVVLIAFSSISLVVSSIMIAIITYISVLERTKEIGILRALGARGKDITRVFNAETMIIGFCSGVLGLLIAYLLTFPANRVIENLTGLAGVAKLNPIHALILLIISITLTVLSGFIPAKMASKKDPVVALRTE